MDGLATHVARRAKRTTLATREQSVRIGAHDAHQAMTEQTANSGPKGPGKSRDVRPRGPSDASSPPSGGWGSGLGRGGETKGVGSTELRTYRTRSLRGHRGAVRRPPAFVSSWDGRLRGSKNQKHRRPHGVINHRMRVTTTGRHAQEHHRSAPQALGVREEVSPWTD